jgi:hypothetical protein
MMAEKLTTQAVLDALKRVLASGRMPMVVDLIDEFDCAASPKPVLDALYALKDAGRVSFKKPLYSDSPIEIIHSSE